MKPQPILVAVLAIAALLHGCASGPRFPTEAVNTSLTPGRAAAQSDAVAGNRVIWGGVIVSTRNLENATRIEVLGYPLDDAQQPRLGESPQSRFLVEQEGYLETADYAPGRRVTVLGTMTGTRHGQVGEARYVFPVVAADQIHLWPRQRPQSEPRVHFGVGVVFGR